MKIYLCWFSYASLSQTAHFYITIRRAPNPSSANEIEISSCRDRRFRLSEIQPGDYSTADPFAPCDILFLNCHVN